MKLSALLTAVLCLLTQHVTGAEYTGSDTCLSCHQYSHEQAIDALMQSAHGDETNERSPAAGRGCEACHGPSTAHAASPTANQPAISFGPRWSAPTEAQNRACLACHEETDMHQNWANSVHARNDTTCVTCHDIHVDTDKVRQSATQHEVCTVCHKVQKSGIHNLPAKKADNPACSVCHDPHNNPAAQLTMLENRSQGCRHCHDLQAMAADERVTQKAKNYHKTMQQQSRTCIDCHRGVAHADKGRFEKILAGALTQREVTLFFPGRSDGDWLRTEHSGAQAYRQGRNCTQCHLGEERDMGQSLASAARQPALATQVTLGRRDDQLRLTVRWEGEADVRSVALMLDDGSVDAFSQGGCWAVCHSDMPGMTRDKGRELEKYLSSSRKQERSIGRRELLFDEKALQEMLRQGQYVSLIRAKLANGAVAELETFRILDRRRPLQNTAVRAEAQFADGRWQVHFTLPFDNALEPIAADTIYTFGLAIHGAGHHQGEHWVSLPLTFSLDGIDTDFVVQ